MENLKLNDKPTIPELFVCPREYIPLPKPSDICGYCCLANLMEIQKDKEIVCQAMQDMLDVKSRYNRDCK